MLLNNHTHNNNCKSYKLLIQLWTITILFFSHHQLIITQKYYTYIFREVIMSTHFLMATLTSLYASKVSTFTKYMLAYGARNHLKGWSVSLKRVAVEGMNLSCNVSTVVWEEEIVPVLFHDTLVRGSLLCMPCWRVLHTLSGSWYDMGQISWAEKRIFKREEKRLLPLQSNSLYDVSMYRN